IIARTRLIVNLNLTVGITRLRLRFVFLRFLRPSLLSSQPDPVEFGRKKLKKRKSPSSILCFLCLFAANRL
ncbi:MAG TPA: hypothetical protein PLA50_18655, partial [Bacteroidia bacterium]|nr:hypothetical protein [Bacteroidia bacterium]